MRSGLSVKDYRAFYTDTDGDSGWFDYASQYPGNWGLNTDDARRGLSAKTGKYYGPHNVTIMNKVRTDETGISRHGHTPQKPSNRNRR
jgi:hypothetical protein